MTGQRSVLKCLKLQSALEEGGGQEGEQSPCKCLIFLVLRVNVVNKTVLHWSIKYKPTP